MLKQSFSPLSLHWYGGGGVLHVSVFLMLHLRRRPERTCKIRSPSRMRPSLAAMLFGLTCRRQNDDIERTPDRFRESQSPRRN